MPKFVVAHRSGAHRLAATALYRVLIAQCKKLDASPQRQQQLHNLIRCRFSAFRHTTSHRELKLLFEAGYEAVDHLDAALAGERKSAQYVWGSVDRAPRQAKESPTAVVQRRSISEQYNDPFEVDVPPHRVLAGSPTTGHGHAAPVEASATLSTATDDAAGAGPGTAIHDETTPVIRKEVPVYRTHAVSPDADCAEEATFEAARRDKTMPVMRKNVLVFRKVAGSTEEPMLEGRSASAHADGAAEQSHEATAQDQTKPAFRKRGIGAADDPMFRKVSSSVPADGAAEASHERKSIFERAVPRGELGGTGRRQVPKIFSANTIPVLRFVKPQPPALTGFLNSRIKQRQRRHDLRHALEEQLPVAAHEDQWDAILCEHAGIASGAVRQRGSKSVTREVEWSSEVRDSLKQVISYLDQERAKNRSMAEKMYAVIDREAQLVEQERLSDEREQTGANGNFEGEPEGLSDMVSEIIGASDGARRPPG